MARADRGSHYADKEGILPGVLGIVETLDENVVLRLGQDGQWEGEPLQIASVANSFFSPGNYGPADGNPGAAAVANLAEWLRDQVGLSNVESAWYGANRKLEEGEVF